MQQEKKWHIIRFDKDSNEFKSLCGKNFRKPGLRLWWNQVNCVECLKLKNNEISEVCE